MAGEMTVEVSLDDGATWVKPGTTASPGVPGVVDYAGADLPAAGVNVEAGQDRRGVPRQTNKGLYVRCRIRAT